MNLRVVVLGSEQHMLVHHFSGFSVDKEYDFSSIESFNDELGVEIDGTPENIYSFVEERKDDFEDDFEERGYPISTHETKEDFFQVITTIAYPKEELEDFNQFIIDELVKQGLEFVKTEDITSDDESAENHYLWKNFLIDGVDTYY